MSGYPTGVLSFDVETRIETILQRALDSKCSERSTRSGKSNQNGENSDLANRIHDKFGFTSDVRNRTS